MLRNEVEIPTGIFGVSLQDSIKYANVAISLMNERNESFIYGYVPIVVAKCGVFLKEKATDVEGIFRLSGSAKRIKELQAAFDTPDRYGKGLDWTGYTVHDAANILRRYLNQLPQPIVPLDFYERCREPLRGHQAHAEGDMEAQGQYIGDFDQNAAISTYQRLITELPPLNRQLLLYILDLLAVFASKSDLNRMTSANLAAIFQPGILSHPSHDMKPHEYRLSQDVLIFLIENQDSFLIGMSGTAADEKTVKEVQSGGPPPRKSQSPSTPRNLQGSLGRSASNASAGADSLRKFGGIRRNVSVSSKNSKTSTNVPSPVSPTPGSPHAGNNTSVGVQRSNTLPSKKSPGIPSAARFNRPTDSPIPTPTTLSAGGYLTPVPRASSPSSRLASKGVEGRSSSTTPSLTPTGENASSLATVDESTANNPSNERLLPNDKLTLQSPPPVFGGQASLGTPTKERKGSGLFAKSPTSDSEHKETRQRNKLRKKRMPDSSNPSAHSSTQSLQGAPDSPANQTFYTPLPTPVASAQIRGDPLASVTPVFSNTNATPVSEKAPPLGEGTQEANDTFPQDQQPPNSGPSLKPSKSPTLSIRSRTSIADLSEAMSEVEHTDDSILKDGQEKKKRRWRLSSSARKNGESRTTLSTNSQLGTNPIAESSCTSIGSSSRPRKSITRDSQQQSTDLPSSLPHHQSSSNDTTPSKEKESSKDKDPTQEASEKKGPFSWIKSIVKKDREAEDRAKSPPRNGTDPTASKQSLSTAAQERPPRGRSAGSAESGGDQPAVGPAVRSNP
ncbi:hypothetical protein MMC22_006770 [Lobaria immixta]|nr:hypothetical protein [Lobaria immixta]